MMLKEVVDAINRSLFRKEASLEIMTNTMELVVCLSACSKPGVSRRVQALFSSMVEYWRSRETDLETCVLFCATFALLAVNNRFLPTIHEAKVPELTLEVMNKHQWNDEQLLVAVRLLAKLAGNDEASRTIVQTGLTAVMRELNARIATSIQVSRTGCQLLYTLAERSEHHDALLKAEIIPYYQALITQYTNDRTILMESLKILVAFSRTPADVTILANMHVTESVLQILHTNIQAIDYEVIRLCTEILIPFTEQKSVRAVVLEAPIFQTVLPTLPRFVDMVANNDVAAYDFLALLQIIDSTVGVNAKKADEKVNPDPKGARLFVQADGVAMLLRMLDRYPNVESVDLIVKILRRVSASEDSLPYFWAAAELQRFLACFAKEAFTADQMEGMAATLKQLLSRVTVEKAAGVKNSAIFATLVDALQRYVEEAKVVNLLLEVMRLLMDVDCKRFCIPEVTDATRKIVEKHAANKAICVKLAQNLYPLSNERRFRHQMWVVDVAAPLATVLQTQPGEEELVMAVLPVVNNLCKREEVAAAVAKAPTVPALFACIQAQSACKTVFGATCTTLFTLVRNCPDALAQFVGDCSPRAIYDGLFRHKDSEETVGAACQLLHVLLSNGDIGLSVLTVEDIAKIRDLMEQSWLFARDETRNDVLSMSLSGLRALGITFANEDGALKSLKSLKSLKKKDEEESDNESEDEDEDEKEKKEMDVKSLKRIGAQDVVEQVVLVFSLHSLEHTRLALAVLAFAALTEKGQKALVATHAVSETLAALAAFVADKDVCVQALNTLRRMMELRAAREAVLRAGVASILAAMRRFEDEREIHIYALETLVGLQEARGFEDALEMEGGVAAVMTSWKNFLEDREVVRVGAAVLSLLSESPRCGEAVVEAGAVQSVLEVLELFAKERAVMIPVCKLMASMAAVPEAKSTLLEEENNVLETLMGLIIMLVNQH